MDNKKFRKGRISSLHYNFSVDIRASLAFLKLQLKHDIQLEYFDKALGIKIDDDIWGKWIEI